MKHHPSSVTLITFQIIKPRVHSVRVYHLINVHTLLKVAAILLTVTADSEHNL